MSYIDGIDQYSASRRRAEVTDQDAHVLLTVEGSDGHGEVLLTTLQATALAGALEAAAIRVAESTAMLDPETGPAGQRSLTAGEKAAEVAKFLTGG